MRNGANSVRTWTPTRMALNSSFEGASNGVRAFLKILMILLFTTGCTKGMPELESLGLSLPGPTIHGGSEITVTSASEEITIAGTYDSRYTGIGI
ncbi:MAG TPA: hypothetical protein VFV50_05430, partial [Bdellovibrionales bacterium]|nr:hypothetical protein [Bdellovibrionales bacterium]